MMSALSIFRRLNPARPRPVDWGQAQEAELALAARDHDRQGKEAFVEIVRRHQTAVCAVAFSVTGRIGLTDDIAQETFLRAWKRIATLREPGKLKAWLTRIAHDCAVDVLRREKSHTLLDEENSREIITTEASPDKAAADAEDEQLVWSALADLPENVRTPLVLFYREGQSVAAVAAALDLSEDAVKQRLSRGRNELREQVAAKVEGVLSRVRPSALLVVTIATAIGLLTAPAALAAGAFSAAAASAASTGSAATASTFSTAMTASSYLVATITMAAFIPLGWKAREPQQTPAPAPPAAAVLKPAKPADPFTAFADSQLLAEWRRLHEVHGTDAAAMPELYKSIADIKDTFHRRALRSALLAEWAAVDPEGAFQELMVVKKQGDHAEQLMREWLKLQPAAAAAFLAANMKGAESMTVGLLANIATMAPEQMAAIANQLPAPRDTWDRRIQDAFITYALKDAAGARAAAESLTGPARGQALAGVASGWAEKDGAGALAWSRTLTEGGERDGALRATLIGWAKGDPFPALANIDAAPPGREEMSFASDTAARVVQSASEKDFEGTLAWMAKNCGKLGNEAWLGLTYAVQKRVSADPAAALTMITSQPEAVRRGLKSAFDSVMLNEGYARKDEVWAWLKQQPPGEFVDALRNTVLRSAGWKEPDQAMKWMAELPDSPESKRILEQSVSSLINNGANLDRIDDLLTTVPEKLRPQLLATAFSSEGDWKMSDLQPWIERVAELPAENRTAAVGSIASRMAATEPEAAIKWASSLTDDDQRLSAIGSLTGRWAGSDSYEASQWVAGLPEGQDRDTAARALVGSIAQSDPEAAWTWAASIRDATERTNSLMTAVHRLKERDPQRARQLIKTTGLSADERTHLLQVLEAKTTGVPR